MTDSNRTEIAPAQAEAPTPAYQHLAPALPARSAGKPGEEMVMAMVPKAFVITLSDGSRQRVMFEVGNYPIPKRLKNHFYLEANGVTFGDQLTVKRPQLETDADPEKSGRAAEFAAGAWPTPEELKAASWDDLALILKAKGVSEEDLKKKPLNATEVRRAKVAEMMAEAEANSQQS